MKTYTTSPRLRWPGARNHRRVENPNLGFFCFNGNQRPRKELRTQNKATRFVFMKRLSFLFFFCLIDCVKKRVPDKNVMNRVEEVLFKLNPIFTTKYFSMRYRIWISTLI